MLYGDFFMSKNIQKYLYDNLGSIIKLLVIFGMGIVIGLFVFNINGEYKEAVKQVFESTKSENFDGINVILNGIKNNGIILLVMYMSLFTYISPAICSSLIFLKGCILSIYSCALIYILGMGKGILFAFLTNIFPSIFSLIAYMLITINICDIFKNLKNFKGINLSIIIKDIYILLIAVSLICFSLVLEQAFSECMIGMYCKI